MTARRLWPVRHPLFPVARFPGAASWHDRFLVLPVHQELREQDLERVATSLRGVLAEETRERPV